MFWNFAVTPRPQIWAADAILIVHTFFPRPDNLAACGKTLCLSDSKRILGTCTSFSSVSSLAGWFTTQLIQVIYINNSTYISFQ